MAEWPERPPTINVTAIEEIDPVPRSADQARWRVSVDDGTIPASIEVYMGRSAATTMRNHEDAAEWIAEQVKRAVRAAPDPATALQQLRLTAPLELRYVS